MNIKNFFLNGKKAKISKDALSEDVSQNLLPTTTSEDVGKVPTVQSDGSYALANAGGGSEPFIMHFTGSDTGTVTPTETIEELVAAFNSGRLCMALFGNTCYYLSNGSSTSPSFFTAPTGIVKRISYDVRAQTWTVT